MRRTMVIVFAAALSLWGGVVGAATSHITFSASGAQGSGVTDVPGIACVDGGDGASWTYAYPAALAPGSFSSLPGQLELLADVHQDASTPGAAWLGDGSSVTVENARGEVILGLTSGSCQNPTLSFDGTVASGSGTWSVASATGSYREAVGTGIFSLTASVGSGSDNPFFLQLDGDLSVLDPVLDVEVARAAWVPDGDPAHRTALVTFVVENVGPGDAFGVELVEAATTTPGVTTVGPIPQPVDDLAAGASDEVTVAYRFDRGRCELIDRGCAADVSLSVELADALDVTLAPHAEIVRVRIPTSPGAP